MKQEQWVDIMVGSIVDQVGRSRKTAKRMAGFFEKRDSEKAGVLKELEQTLTDAEKKVQKLYDEVEWQGNK